MGRKEIDIHCLAAMHPPLPGVLLAPEMRDGEQVHVSAETLLGGGGVQFLISKK